MDLNTTLERRLRVAQALAKAPMGSSTVLDHLRYCVVNQIAPEATDHDEQTLDLLLAISKHLIGEFDSPQEFKIDLNVAEAVKIEPILSVETILIIQKRFPNHEILDLREYDGVKIGAIASYPNNDPKETYKVIAFVKASLGNTQVVVEHQETGTLYTDTLTAYK